MYKLKKPLLLTLVLMLGLGMFNLSSAQASTNYVTASKTVNPSSILVGGEAEVTLNIQGTPPINVVKPNDVILVIDRSGSMGSEKMNSAKQAAKGFIDLMDLNTHQVGIVDYAENVYEGVPLTNDASIAKSYIDKITSGGRTGTAPAIEKAKELLASHRPEAQPVIVLMTDGDATTAGDGLDPYDYTLKKAQEAKDAGIVFYTIALLDLGTDPDTSGPNKLLKDMATTSHHHHFVLGSTGLSDIYAAIVKEIGLASAYDVVINDIVPDNFEIVPDSYNNNIPKPTVSGNTLSWNFLELKKDTLSFTYKIRQKQGGTNGTYPVTKSGSVINYKDYTGASRSYKIPSADLVINYLPPIIHTVTPDKGALTGGEVVTITGENFLPNAKVYLFNRLVNDSTVVNGQEITFTTPVGVQGKVELKVVNPDNQAAKSSFNYYIDPLVTSITPDNGPIDGGTSVKIIGKYFLPGIVVKFGDQPASSVTFNNDTYLFARTPATSSWGPVDVTLENPDGTSVVVKDGFTYNEPPKITLTGISPAEGLTTGNEDVILTGTEFKQGMKVYFNSTEVPISYVSTTTTTSVKVKTPAWNQPETVDVKVVSANGKEAILTQAYTYLAPPPPPAPVIDSVSPNSTRVDKSILTYIDGANFNQGAKVEIGEVELSVTFVSDKRLRVKTPLVTEAATVDVKVMNPDGQFAVKAQAFTYEPMPEAPEPTITTVTPASGPMSGGGLIYVDGKNYQTGIVLEWIQNNETTTIQPEYINNTRIRIRVPATSVHGPVDIKVVNPDGKHAAKVAAYSYDAPPVYPDPVISSVTPNSGNKSGGGLVDIVGEHFQRGATVTFGPQSASVYAFVDQGLIRVRVPASSIAQSVDITLTNPDGKSVVVTNAYTYVESKPEITSITPPNGPLKGGNLIYVDGRYFEPGLVVTIGGVSINAEYINNTRIRIKVPEVSVPGTVDVVLTNPSGISATAQYTYDAPPPVPAPVLKTLSPSSGPISGNTLLYVDGSNFQKGAVVDIDGITYNAEYINTTRVRLRTPKVDSPRMVPVKLINPDGQETGVLYFEYK